MAVGSQTLAVTVQDGRSLGVFVAVGSQTLAVTDREIEDHGVIAAVGAQTLADTDKRRRGVASVLGCTDP